MRKFKKLLAVGACLCMSLSLLTGCGSGSSSSDSGAKQESNKSSDLSFAFCTNTLNNTFQSSIDAKLKELSDTEAELETAFLRWEELEEKKLQAEAK